MNVIEQAAELGRAAFERGAKRVPALDVEFSTNLLPLGIKEVGAIPVLDAWLDAWDRANLAAPVPEIDEIFGKVISSYTRKQAIEDGVLVDANSGDFDEVTRQHFKYPVAMSARLFEIISKAVANKKHCNDFKGVWHDICHMSKTVRSANAHISVFRVIITGAARNRYWDLKAVCGPDDDGKPCITFLLRHED